MRLTNNERRISEKVSEQAAAAHTQFVPLIAEKYHVDHEKAQYIVGKGLIVSGVCALGRLYGLTVKQTTDLYTRFIREILTAIDEARGIVAIDVTKPYEMIDDDAMAKAMSDQHIPAQRLVRLVRTRPSPITAIEKQHLVDCEICSDVMVAMHEMEYDRGRE